MFAGGGTALKDETSESHFAFLLMLRGVGKELEKKNS